MKRIPFSFANADAPFKSREILSQIASLPNGGKEPITADEMRKRMRILDAIDAATDHVDLEDADHELLKRLANAFPFAVARRELVTILDDIANAVNPG